MYCYQCGYGMSYAGAPPNFCMKCGTKMGDAKAATQKEPVTEEQQEVVNVIEEESEDINTIPDLSGLDVEIDIQSNSVTFGELAEAGNPPPSQGNDDFKSPRRKKKSKKQFLDDFRKEAGSLRRKGEET